MKKRLTIATKKGAASFYVVIFTALVLGVITLSFVRIMISDASKTTDTDLSQSAYDSALAGVEDAKSALVKCSRSNDGCTSILPKEDRAPECNQIAPYLYSNRGQNPTAEVQLSENLKGDQGTQSQAYTCVKLNNITQDYRATIKATERVKIVPLRVEGGFGKANSIKISWYPSDEWPEEKNPNKIFDRLFPATDPGAKYFGINGVAQEETEGTMTAPVLSVGFIQTDKVFTFSDLTENNGPNNNATDRSTMILYPVKNGGQENNVIKDSEVAHAGHIEAGNNQPYYINCSAKETEFGCEALLQLPPPLHGNTGSDRKSDTAFLILATPYNLNDVKFKIEVYPDKDGKERPIKFENVQYSVDSTGRANDIYRRVETRVELGNVYFPYPEYALQLSNTNDGAKSALRKNFWITRGCQKTKGEKIYEDKAERHDYGFDLQCVNSAAIGP